MLYGKNNCYTEEIILWTEEIILGAEEIILWTKEKDNTVSSRIAENGFLQEFAREFDLIRLM